MRASSRDGCNYTFSTFGHLPRQFEQLDFLLGSIYTLLFLKIDLPKTCEVTQCKWDALLFEPQAIFEPFAVFDIMTLSE